VQKYQSILSKKKTFVVMKKNIIVPRTAHYYIQIPELKVQRVLYVIHGYAQKASDFLKEFGYLKKSNCLVIAPEALSKFYNKKGEAVANWMTVHQRLDEINDYVGYLNQVQDEILQEYGKLTTAALGFSQGTSTLMRWCMKSKLPMTHLYLCSGSIPPEMSKENVKHFNGQLHFYYGNKDKLFPLEKVKLQLKKLASIELNFIEKPFEGRHEISEFCKKDIIATTQVDQ
tara:strand:- start:367 stop:1053 length:687 start_codon:yes stop_codon:yes gene_type:complete